MATVFAFRESFSKARNLAQAHRKASNNTSLAGLDLEFGSQVLPNDSGSQFFVSLS
jgi:hypothetical protein